MKTSAVLLSVFFFVLPLVQAHGIVGQISVDGQSYQGPIAGGDQIPGSPVRQISDPSPVKGAMNQAMTCGPDAKPASFNAPANPGSTIEVLWQANDRQHWPHNTGPMEVYLASCGSVSCDKFDASNAQWFKITEVGKRTGGWVQQDQFDGKAHSFTLPSNLASGGYLLRHEIIALHLADQPGGAEFYPACVQLDVGGNQSGAPSPNELVTFPGAYSDNDPGILVNAFSDAPYDFPGPAISKLAASGNGSNGGTGDDNGSPSSSPTPSKSPVPSMSPVPSTSGSKTKTPVQSSPSAAPNGSKGCKPTKKRAVFDDSDYSVPPAPPSVPKKSRDDFPRHMSRVMGRLFKPYNH